MNYSELEDGAGEQELFQTEGGASLSARSDEATEVSPSSLPANQGYDPYLLAIRITSILFLLCLLFVAALYYGLINP